MLQLPTTHLESLGIQQGLNKFAMKRKLYIKVLQELQGVKAATA